MKLPSLPTGHWTGDRALGTIGHLGVLAFSLTAAVLARGWRVAIACGIVLLLATIFCRAGLRSLRRPQLWLFLGFLVVPTALFLGPADRIVLGIPISWAGLAAGLQLALRAVSIVVAVAGFSTSVSAGELAGLLERVGLKGLGFAFGVAVNLLPTLQETANTTYHALRLRGGFRRRRFRALRLLLITVVANSLRHADDVVSAAESRAFSVEQAQRRPLRRGRGDLALAGFLLAVVLALVLL